MWSVSVIQLWTRNQVILFHGQCHRIIFMTNHPKTTRNPRQSLLKCVFLSCIWNLDTDNVHSCNIKGLLWHVANKVLPEAMWMARLTSLTLVVSLTAAGWGLFWRELWRLPSSAVNQINFHTNTLGLYQGEASRGRRKKKNSLTNSLKIRQIASFSPEVYQPLPGKSWNPVLIQHQSSLCVSHLNPGN